VTYHKYGAKKTTIDGITFDSKREATRYSNLCLLERAGAITDLELQPKFELQPSFRDVDGKHQRAIYYIADFAYDEPGCDRRIVEDVKGMETAVFKLKKKLFLFTHPDYELRVVK
jgi:hypothetical protein